MSNYDKIASGLTSHYTEKAKKRMAEKVELKFNRSKEAYDQALKSKDGKMISKVVHVFGILEGSRRITKEELRKDQYGT